MWASARNQHQLQRLSSFTTTRRPYLISQARNERPRRVPISRQAPICVKLLSYDYDNAVLSAFNQKIDVYISPSRSLQVNPKDISIEADLDELAVVVVYVVETTHLGASGALVDSEKVSHLNVLLF